MQEFSGIFRKMRLISVVLAGGLVLLYGVIYLRLPTRVPVHMTGLGKIDGYGPKQTIFLLPVTNLIFALSWPVQLQKFQAYSFPGLRRVLIWLSGLLFLVLCLGTVYFSVIYLLLASR